MQIRWFGVINTCFEDPAAGFIGVHWVDTLEVWRVALLSYSITIFETSGDDRLTINLNFIGRTKVSIKPFTTSYLNVQ